MEDGHEFSTDLSHQAASLAAGVRHGDGPLGDRSDVEGEDLRILGEARGHAGFARHVLRIVEGRLESDLPDVDTRIVPDEKGAGINRAVGIDIAKSLAGQTIQSPVWGIRSRLPIVRPGQKMIKVKGRRADRAPLGLGIDQIADGLAIGMVGRSEAHPIRAHLFPVMKDLEGGLESQLIRLVQDEIDRIEVVAGQHGDGPYIHSFLHRQFNRLYRLLETVLLPIGIVIGCLTVQREENMIEVLELIDPLSQEIAVGIHRRVDTPFVSMIDEVADRLSQGGFAAPNAEAAGSAISHIVNELMDLLIREFILLSSRYVAVGTTGVAVVGHAQHDVDGNPGSGVGHSSGAQAHVQHMRWFHSRSLSASKCAATLRHPDPQSAPCPLSFLPPSSHARADPVHPLPPLPPPHNASCISTTSFMAPTCVRFTCSRHSPIARSLARLEERPTQGFNDMLERSSGEVGMHRDVKDGAFHLLGSRTHSPASARKKR